MQEEKFNLEEFRKNLEQFQQKLEQDLAEDPNYEGEIDDIREALKRLCKEFKDKKYEQILPDIMNVFSFMGLMQIPEEEEFEEIEFDEHS
jgi:hypothetical protein